MNDKLRAILSGANMLHFEGERQNIEQILEHLEGTVGYMDDTDALYANMTVQKYLRYFADLLDARDMMPAAIEQMHLEEIQKKKIGRCTEGEKRRVSIARELLKGASTYILVNPLEGMDSDTQKLILGWMDSFQGRENKLITLSQSQRYTCLCPGDHYEITEDSIVCIDRNEVSEENPELPAINKITVTYDEKMFLFNPEEIDYVEANEGQVYVYVQNERYVGAFKMGELEERLVKFGFFRCHRSYIVNMQKVVELVKWTRNSYSLKLARYEKTDIPLSKAKIQELKSMYEF